MRHRNHGLRKRCGCPRTKWPKCSHGWHFNFRSKGVSYRLSLDRECGRHISTKTEAKEETDRIRAEIRDGTYQSASSPQTTLDDLTFAQFSKVWEERRGKELVRPRDNRYRLDKIEAFVLPGTEPPITLGEKPPAVRLAPDHLRRGGGRIRDPRRGKGDPRPDHGAVQHDQRSRARPADAASRGLSVAG